MAVDAADADRGAVDEEPVAVRLHPPEPDPPPVRLRLARVPGDDDLEVVEHGLLGRPRAHAEGSGLEPPPGAPRPVDRPARGAAPGDRAECVPDRRLELEAPGLDAEVDGVHAESPATPFPRPGSQSAVEVELAEMERRHGEQEDVPPDPEQRHVGVPAHVVEHGIRRVLGQGDREVVGAGRRNGVRSTSKDVAPLPCTPASVPLTTDLGSAVRAVAAQEDGAARPGLGQLERPMEGRDAILGHEPVVDDVAGDARRRPRRARAIVAGERPAAKAPFPAEIQAVGGRRQLAQAAGDVARVHDNSAVATAARRSRSSTRPCRPSGRPSCSGIAEQAARRRSSPSIAAASPVTRTADAGKARRHRAPPACRSARRASRRRP